MAYSVGLRPAAARRLRKLPRVVQRRIARTLDGLAQHPRPTGAKKLVGERSMYRVRVGSYRVVYRVSDAERSVEVTHIAHRREAYR